MTDYAEEFYNLNAEANRLDRARAEPSDQPIAPGDHLRSKLERRSWTQGQFAEILDRPVQFVNEIIGGKKEITRVSAAQLGAALGTSAEFWLRLQDTYLLWRQGQDERVQRQLDGVKVRARNMERNKDHEVALEIEKRERK